MNTPSAHPLQDDAPREQIPSLPEGAAVPASFRQLHWRDRLEHVVETMRELSGQTDPQVMVKMYAKRMRGAIAPGHTISISRRDLSQPRVRISRTTLWKEQPDPWRERHRLPVLEGGVLADLLYADRPQILQEFGVPADDPAEEYLRHARSLIAIPHYENGVALNMAVHTGFEPNAFDEDRFPELVQMSNLFGRTTKNLVLSRDLREALDTLDAELKAVQEIQLSLLPREQPAIRTLDVATHYQTSKRAGGDYYDFFQLSSGKWGILVADVSGHGTPAAVLMAIVHAIAHMMPGEPMPPDRAMEFVNRALTTRYTRGGGAFVTMIYGVYDDATRTLSFANAGHPAPLVRGVDGRIRAIDHPDAGVPLGILEDTRYASHDLVLAPGEDLVLYTDGITEAFSASGEMFGDDRLLGAIKRAEPGEGSGSVVNAIVQDLGLFAGLSSRSDDRTLVVARVR
jgi:sigma-B regulation protein RsbU (phosphoserine phosphatase)